jgi:hypothetical protein
MKKKYLNLLVLFSFIIGLIPLASCSDNDDEESGNDRVRQNTFLARVPLSVSGSGANCGILTAGARACFEKQY